MIQIFKIQYSIMIIFIIIYILIYSHSLNISIEDFMVFTIHKTLLMIIELIIECLQLLSLISIQMSIQNSIVTSFDSLINIQPIKRDFFLSKISFMTAIWISKLSKSWKILYLKNKIWYEKLWIKFIIKSKFFRIKIFIKLI